MLSSVGILAGAYFLATGKLLRLSQQELMDCSWGYGNNACDGGEEFRYAIFLATVYFSLSASSSLFHPSLYFSPLNFFVFTIFPPLLLPFFLLTLLLFYSLFPLVLLGFPSSLFILFSRLFILLTRFLPPTLHSLTF